MSERERTKQQRCHEEHETMRRAMELTFPRQAAMSADQDDPTTAQT